MTVSDLQTEINSLPSNLRQEVADFVGFLKSKKATKRKLKEREFGFAKSKIKLSKDFDEPEDIAENTINYTAADKAELDARVNHYLNGGKMVSAAEMNKRIKAARKKEK